MAYYPKAFRILDTRNSGGLLQPMVPRRVGVLPSPPADWARVVKVNLTSVDPREQGWISIDGGQTSELNFERAQEVTNEVGVPIQQDAAGWYFNVWANVPTDLVVDLKGWDSLI